MKEFIENIRAVLDADPGARGTGCRAADADIARLIEELPKMQRVLIVTGFPMKAKNGGIVCETDGPAGAADMAHALIKLGVRTSLVTDGSCLMQVRAAADCRACGARVYLLKKGEPAAAERLVRDIAPTHIIAIERPGKATDGHYHTARGAVIDDMCADTDILFEMARAHGAVTLAIGDGGNELGTGICREAVARLIPGGGVIAAKAEADITLMSGVSNWWGWGIAAFASVVLAKRELLPSDEQELRLMRELIVSGAVDGVTKLPTLTVDSLSMETNLAILRALRTAVREYLIRRPQYD